MSLRLATLRYFWSHLKKKPVLLFLTIVGGIVGSGLQLGYALIFKEFVDAMVAATTGSKEQVLSQVFMLFGILLASDLLSVGGWRTSTYSYSVMQPQVMKAISLDCFESIHRHSVDFFANNFVGALVKKVNRMVRGVDDLMSSVVFELLPLVTKVVVIGIVLTSLDYRIGVFMGLWMIVYLTIQIWVSFYKVKRFDLPKAAADSAVSGALADTFTNHTAVQFFARRVYELKRFGAVVEDWRGKQQGAWIFDCHIESVQAFFMVFLNVGVLAFAIHGWTLGTFTIGAFFLIQVYMEELFREFWGVGRVLRHFYEHFADAQEMMQILVLEPEIQDKKGARKLVVSRGAIEFEQVSFSYRVQKNKEVIQALDLSIKPGERVALIGPSGGGKTTLTKLLLRLFDVKSGAVKIDGQDLSTVTQDSLRGQIALVPQDPVLFHRSLLENIRYGRLNATDAEVKAAAKMAHCHEFISRLPEGYETFVGERGVKLSGGERQRVAIARAILANTKILILDEATSSLDSESEQLIKDALAKLMKGKTVLVIAHRLSTVVDMDRILVLERGKIVEAGSHAELIKRGGLYERLWNLQVGGYLA